MAEQMRGKKKHQRKKNIGWVIWNQAMATEFCNKKCQFCEHPLLIGDKYYVLDDNPLKFGHAKCVWKSIDEEAKKQGV
jgi:hypothetical protein